MITQQQSQESKVQQIFPVIEERLKIEKQLVESGGVRLTKVVHEREEVVDEALMKEQIHVERVPINSYIDTPIEIRYEGDKIIIPVIEEVLVKRLLLKEELHITKKLKIVHRPQSFTLRQEEVIVEDIQTPSNE